MSNHAKDSSFAGRQEAEEQVAKLQAEVVLLRGANSALTARAELAEQRADLLNNIHNLVLVQLRTLVVVAQSGNTTTLATALEQALGVLAPRESCPCPCLQLIYVQTA
ncbi:hypothetical protein C8F01DRAFT_1259736 [Mycena amicta]|nr:hypothetical protein C8F01DRAFT_1259736 [Mycena amicta]